MPTFKRKANVLSCNQRSLTMQTLHFRAGQLIDPAHIEMCAGRISWLELGDSLLVEVLNHAAQLADTFVQRLAQTGQGAEGARMLQAEE